MKRLLKLLLAAACTGVSLFVATLVIYYFNLDMKLLAKVQAWIQPWYDHIERRPLVPPKDDPTVKP